jgi:hypothetical protein
MTRVFLSYRREDSQHITGRIYDRLEAQFGVDGVFMDVDTIPLGEDFRDTIHQAVSQCDVCLVVIGEGWLEVESGSKGRSRRLDDRRDFVRVEIETALRQNIPIIPVLVGTAGMPSPEELPESIEPLAYRNAGMVRPGRDFRVDIERLIEAIRRLAGETENAESQVAQARPEQRREAEPGQRLAIRFADLARDPSILSDAQIGSYQIRELLGSGGSGAVYRAHNPRLGQEACIKLSYPLLSHAEAIRRAIGRGIRGVVAMNHPNISRIFDFDQVLLEDGSSFFVAMELIAGSNLDDWAKNLPAVDESFLPRLQVARLIALALQAAHDCSYFDDTGFQLRGVMHGDVKPSNIRVRPDNTPVVIDFMLVDVQRLLDRENPATQILSPPAGKPITAAFGTPGFMAPEQERDGIVTVATDIFGLGMTLAHIFFDEPTYLPVLAGRRQVPAMSAREKQLLELFRLMTEENPATRPPDMAAVADELEGIARSLGAEASPETQL